MQPLIAGYAVPVLEEQPLWGTDDDTRTAYLDTQDVAKMTSGGRAQRRGGEQGDDARGPEGVQRDAKSSPCAKSSAAPKPR